jgi:hypothetical protein
MGKVELTLAVHVSILGNQGTSFYARMGSSRLDSQSLVPVCWMETTISSTSYRETSCGTVRPAHGHVELYWKLECA